MKQEPTKETIIVISAIAIGLTLGVLIYRNIMNRKKTERVVNSGNLIQKNQILREKEMQDVKNKLQMFKDSTSL